MASRTKSPPKSDMTFNPFKAYANHQARCEEERKARIAQAEEARRKDKSRITNALYDRRFSCIGIVHRYSNHWQVVAIREGQFYVMTVIATPETVDVYEMSAVDRPKS
jgi:hypothetical protein